MPQAARVSDLHTCPMCDGPKPHVGGPILPPGAPTVLIEGLPAAKVGDLATCLSPAPDVLIMGSATVVIEKRYACRVGDQTAHGGTVTAAASGVLIGVPGDGIIDKEAVRHAGLLSSLGIANKAPTDGSNNQPKVDSKRASRLGPEIRVEKSVPPVAKFHPVTVPLQLLELGDEAIFVSDSYDPDDGTDPGAGISSVKWVVITPGEVLERMDSQLHLPITNFGKYKLHLVARDNEGYEAEAAPLEFTIQKRTYILRIMGNGPGWFRENHDSFMGHIFVAWGCQVEDGPIEMGDHVGFGPKHGTRVGWVSSGDGELWMGDRNGPVDESVDFIVSRQEYQQTRSSVSTFESSSYSAVTHDCVSFVRHVASSAGLKSGLLGADTEQTPIAVLRNIRARNASRIFHHTKSG